MVPFHRGHYTQSLCCYRASSVAIVSSGAGDPPCVSSIDVNSGVTLAGDIRRLRVGRLLAGVERFALGRRLAGARRLAFVRRLAAVREATRSLVAVRRFEGGRRFAGVRFLRAERAVAAGFLRFAMSCLLFSRAHSINALPAISEVPSRMHAICCSTLGCLAPGNQFVIEFAV
jgi:hypothetical protein